MRQAGSSGLRQAGRVLEFVDERLEQKDDQEMSQHMWSGGAFVETWRPFEADQALQAFEAEFDAPSQTVEVENIFRRLRENRALGNPRQRVARLHLFRGCGAAYP